MNKIHSEKESFVGREKAPKVSQKAVKPKQSSMSAGEQQENSTR